MPLKAPPPCFPRPASRRPTVMGLEVKGEVMAKGRDAATEEEVDAAKGEVMAKGRGAATEEEVDAARQRAQTRPSASRESPVGEALMCWLLRREHRL